MTNKSRYFLILLVGIFSVLTYFHAVARDTASSSFSDFGNYWLNAQMLRDGFNVWSTDKDTEDHRAMLADRYDFKITYPSVNSLGFSAFVGLFTLFDFRQAAVIWNILNQIALLLSIWLMLKMVKIKPLSEEALFVLFLVFSFWPIREALHLGQVTFLSMLLVTASVFLMKDHRWVLAGILLSFAIQTKEHIALSLLVFVWKKNWKVLIGVALGFFSVKILEISIFGLHRELAYWRFLFGFGTQAHLGVNNHSLMSAICRVGNNPSCGFVGAAFLIGLAGLAFFWTRRTADALSSFFPFLILSFIASPWVNETHYMILCPAIISIWFSIDKIQSRHHYVLFILAYLLLGVGYSLNSFPRFHFGILSLFTVGKLLGAIILFILSGKIANYSEE